MGKSEWDDDLLNDGEGDSSLVKDLRRQLRAAKKDIEERDEKIAGFAKVSRERSVESVLTSKGVRKGIAKFIPSDITDEADIEKWLEDNAEDLGITLGNGSDNGDAGSDPDPSTKARRRCAGRSRCGPVQGFRSRGSPEQGAVVRGDRADHGRGPSAHHVTRTQPGTQPVG